MTALLRPRIEISLYVGCDIIAVGNNLPDYI